MHHEFVAFEIDENGCRHLKTELPLDLTEAEIAYIESLVPYIVTGFPELRDPRPARWYSVADPRSLACCC